MKPLFISFEGVDGCGKSTQVKLLQDWLIRNGLKTITTHDPGGTFQGEMIRSLIKNPEMKGITPSAELMLFAASRVQLCETVIEPAIKKGQYVIADRFIDSGYAYQAYGRGIDIKKVKKSIAIATDGIKPDITFFIDLTPADAFKRKDGMEAGNRTESYPMEFFDKVYKGFKTHIRNNRSRIKSIEGQQTIEKIHADVIKELKKKYAEFSAFS